VEERAAVDEWDEPAAQESPPVTEKPVPADDEWEAATVDVVETQAAEADEWDEPTREDADQPTPMPQDGSEVDDWDRPDDWEQTADDERGWPDEDDPYAVEAITDEAAAPYAVEAIADEVDDPYAVEPSAQAVESDDPFTGELEDFDPYEGYDPSAPVPRVEPHVPRGRLVFLASLCFALTAAASFGLATALALDGSFTRDLLGRIHDPATFAGLLVIAQVAIAATVSAMAALVAVAISTGTLRFGSTWAVCALVSTVLGIASAALGTLAIAPLAAAGLVWMGRGLSDAIRGRRLYVHALLALALVVASAALAWRAADQGQIRLGSPARAPAGEKKPEKPTTSSPVQSLDYDRLQDSLKVEVEKLDPEADFAFHFTVGSVSKYAKDVTDREQVTLGPDVRLLVATFDSDDSAKGAFDALAEFRDPIEGYPGMDRVVQSSTGGGFDNEWTTQLFTVALVKRQVMILSYSATSKRSQADAVSRQGQLQHDRALKAISRQLSDPAG
jgi:hypothetical protein